MYYKKVILFAIILFTSNLGLAQRFTTNATYISVYAGDLAILSEKFLDSYGSKNELAFGVGFGLPLNNSYTLNISATYFGKNSNLAELSGSEQILNSSLEQIIFNTGLQIHLLPNRIIGLSLLGGMTYSIIDEEKEMQTGEIVSQINESGNFGLYIGANFEISFGRSPLALFGDVKYSYSWNPILEYEDTYREVRYTGGLKLYLSQRWK